jgi:hypothetical protein
MVESGEKVDILERSRVPQHQEPGDCRAGGRARASRERQQDGGYSRQTLSERRCRIGYGGAAQERLLGELRTISERVARMPELDHRTDEEIVGYDEFGIPR